MTADLIYHGSMVEFVGLDVASVDECWCSDCLRVAPWDRRMLVRLVKRDGGSVRLEHCRHTSLVAATSVAAARLLR